MKIVICTTPIRPVPTVFPPFGSMAIINALNNAGYESDFYDIDGLRPTDEEVERHFAETKPDVLGISAVVSTAYAYTKKLVRIVKKASPNTRIILGGNLAASAEILHRLAGVEVCVIGEGEIVVVNLMRALEGMTGPTLDTRALEGIKGITFIREDGVMSFAGYETRILPDEVFRPDFGLLEKYSKIGHYVYDAGTRVEIMTEPRLSDPRRAGKKAVTLITEKGCVSRCTFCHRWDKGYRVVPVDQIIAHMKHLIERYNVGFFSFGDENFGSDKRWADEFLEKIAPLDILWTAGGVRVRSVTLDLLKRMKQTGCVSIFYGMETGSPKILEVMEKKAKLQDNINAANWTREAGLFTIYQMIIGMPGEDEKTIGETIEFLKSCTQDFDASPRALMSLNYIQALPGTPVYEYARHIGLIGKTLLEEEQYLIKISDIDAGDDAKMPNYTEYDNLTLRSWRKRIVLEVMKHYHDHNKTPIPSFPAFLLRLATNGIKKARNHFDESRERVIDEYSKGGFFNLQKDLAYDFIVAYFYPMRNLFIIAGLLRDEIRDQPFRVFVAHLWAWVRCRMSPPKSSTDGGESLRALMTRLAPADLTPNERAMQPMRDGR